MLNCQIGLRSPIKSSIMHCNFAPVSRNCNPAIQRIRLGRTLATAKPTGGAGDSSSKPAKSQTPASRASPKKKLPEETAASKSAARQAESASKSAARQTESASKSVARQAESVSKSVARQADSTSKSVARQADSTSKPAARQVDSTATSAKQGVDDLANSTKRATENVQSGTVSARRQVNEQAESLQDGIDAGADATKDAVEQGAQSAQEFADDFERRASRAADRAEVNFERASTQLQEGIDETSRRVENVIDEAPGEVRDTVQQAVDQTAAGIRGAQRQFDELQKPGPSAPFEATPLTSLDPSPFESRPGPKTGEAKQGDYFKQRLFYCVAGLDRGFAANKSAQAEVEATVSSLLSVSAPVLLSWAPEEGKESSSLAQLNGTWRLLYSSAFAKGQAPPSLPGYRLGQVYQSISAYASRLDNIVELYGSFGFPLPGVSFDPVVTTATLRHYFEALGGSTVQITFEDTEVKSTGGPNGILGRLPELSLPQLPEGLRPSRSSRASTFEVLYLDDELRITRGRRGELRVFLRT